MGVLAPVSAHAGPSAQPLIGTSGNFFGTRVCRVNFTKFPHFPVKIGLIGGLGGVPQFFLSHSNPIIIVTFESLQNFETVAQTLLGEIAHFSFFPPLRGVPKMFLSLLSPELCSISNKN